MRTVRQILYAGGVSPLSESLRKSPECDLKILAGLEGAAAALGLDGDPGVIVIDALCAEETRIFDFIRKFSPTNTIIISGGSIPFIEQALKEGAEDFLGNDALGESLLLRRITLAAERKNYLEKFRNLDTIIENESIRKTAAYDQLYRLLIPILARVAESYDPDLGMHHRRIMNYTQMTAESLFFHPESTEILTPDYIALLSMASSLHDLGNVYLDTDILLKHERLSEEEVLLIRNHTLEGDRFFRDIAGTEVIPEMKIFLGLASEICLNHHEHYDGTGYPNGRKGVEIPLSARIVSVVDTYDSLRLRRPYREAWTHERAFDYIKSESGKKFDPDVVEAFSLIQNQLNVNNQDDPHAAKIS